MTLRVPQMDRDRRKLIWIALSELWLDTELAEGDLRRIAAVLTASGLPIEELRRVYRFEVAPVVCLNLWTPVGVWDGFDPEWLCAEIERRLHARGPFGSIWLRVVGLLMTRGTAEQWATVERLLDEGIGAGVDDAV